MCVLCLWNKFFIKIHKGIIIFSNLYLTIVKVTVRFRFQTVPKCPLQCESTRYRGYFQAFQASFSIIFNNLKEIYNFTRLVTA